MKKFKTNIALELLIYTAVGLVFATFAIFRSNLKHHNFDNLNIPFLLVCVGILCFAAYPIIASIEIDDRQIFLKKTSFILINVQVIVLDYSELQYSYQQEKSRQPEFTLRLYKKDKYLGQIRADMFNNPEEKMAFINHLISKGCRKRELITR